MFIKKREKSISHVILESLYARGNLSKQEKYDYFNQAKGYEGEQKFDKLLEESSLQGLVISDLFLSNGYTHFQFDSVVILKNHIHIYEVKNYEGSYSYEDGSLYSKNGFSMQDPVGQVKRKMSYLHNLLLAAGFSQPIKSSVVFIHPNFYIYNLPETESITFVGQLDDHFKNLTRFNKTIRAKNQDVAEFLLSKHNENYRPDNLPTYEFGDLKKGIYCPKCFSFACFDKGQERICRSCGLHENILDAIYRNVLEFQFLFPEIRVNVAVIYEWCGRNYSKFRIRSVLNNKMTVFQNGKNTFYE